MNRQSILTAGLALAIAGTSFAAGNTTDGPNNADLIYNPATGNLQLDSAEAAGGVVTVFQIENAVGGDDFNDGNYISLTGGTFGGVFETVSPTVIGDSDFTFAGFSGVVDLGNVAPTGLDLTGLESFLTNAIYTGQSGSGAQTLDLVVIPEPSSLALVGLGGLLMARRRK